MYCEMPVIWFETVKETKVDDKHEEDEDEFEGEQKINFFECPIFKTTKRTGIISSSGRSENFIISVVRKNILLTLYLFF